MKIHRGKSEKKTINNLEGLEREEYPTERKL